MSLVESKGSKKNSTFIDNTIFFHCIKSQKNKAEIRGILVRNGSGVSGCELQPLALPLAFSSHLTSQNFRFLTCKVKIKHLLTTQVTVRIRLADITGVKPLTHMSHSGKSHGNQKARIQIPGMSLNFCYLAHSFHFSVLCFMLLQHLNINSKL